MADRIRAIGRLQASPSGTFRQLGAKRSATVLWKAVVKGDNAGVSLTLAKSSIRHQAHEAVGTAKGELKNERTFTNDLNGLRQLLDRAHPDPGFLDHPVLGQAYRLALFDAAWDATIGKAKLAVTLTKQDGVRHRHEGTATIKAALREFAGKDNWNTVDKTIRALSENVYLPRYSVSGGAMPRTVGWDSLETDLRPVPRMPRGVSAATGSNYRMPDPHTTEWRPPPHVTTEDAFAITQSRSAGTFAVSLGREPHGGASACQDMNKALQAGGPQNKYVGGFIARCLSESGSLNVKAMLQDRQTLLAFYPGDGFVDIAAADPSNPGPSRTLLPPGAFLVFLSGGAGEALGEVSAAALNKTMGPGDINRIAEIDDLQEELSKLITAGTMKAIERKEKAVEKFKTFEYYLQAGALQRAYQVQPTVDMINAMLDGAYPPPDPAAGRVSMDQSEKKFQESVQWCAKELDEVQRRISELGGDMTILVVDPVEALGIDTMAAKPPAPPPVSPEDADFLFNPESLHKGGPVGRWRQPPGNDKGKEPESPPDEDPFEFDLDDYV